MTGAGAVLAMVTVLLGFLLQTSHARYQRSMEETTQNLALSLDTFLSSHFQAIDLALQSAQSEFVNQHQAGRFSDAAFGRYLAGLHQRLPNAVAVRGVNTAGQIAWGEGTGGGAAPNLADREFFQRARDERRLVFGLPVVSRLTGKRVLPVALPLFLPDGRFGGVAYVNTAQSRLLSLFASLQLGPHGVVTLYDERGHILVREPEPPARPDAGSPSPPAMAGGWLVALSVRHQQGSFHGTSAVDGQVRTLAYRRLGSYPLFVAVGVSETDYLAPWRREALIAGGFLLVLGGGIVAGVRGLRRSWQREAQVQSLRAVQAAHEHLAAVMAAIPDALLEMDLHGRIVHTPGGPGNSHVERSLAGRLLTEQLPDEARKALIAALAEACDQGFCYGTELRLPGPSGDRHYELSVARKDSLRDDDDPTLIVLSRDVTERRQAEAQIEQLAFSDLLTKLPNRRLFLDRLHHSMAASQRSGQLSALLFLDLDHFKSVNDTLGHLHGDQLLVQVAQRLRQLVREADTVARLGGDEFVVILEQLADNEAEAAAQALQVAEKVVAQLDGEYELNGQRCRTSVSVGVALLQGQSLSPEELLRRADMSMYQAKSAGRNGLRLFNPRSHDPRH